MVAQLRVWPQLPERGFLPTCSVSLASKAVEAVELLVDATRQLEGVGVVKGGFERLDLWTGFRCGFKHPLPWSTGLIIAANHTRAFTGLSANFHGGLEQILKDPKLLVELIDHL